MDKKRAAIQCYESQFKAGKKEHIIESVLNENKYWGFQTGVEAGEPFYQREITLFENWPEGYR